MRYFDVLKCIQHSSAICQTSVRQILVRLPSETPDTVLEPVGRKREVWLTLSTLPQTRSLMISVPLSILYSNIIKIIVVFYPSGKSYEHEHVRYVRNTTNT